MDILATYNSPVYGWSPTIFRFCTYKGECRWKIACPCPKCRFKKWQAREVVFEHCIMKQFPRKYVFWAQHGEYDYAANVDVGSSSHIGRDIGGTSNNVAEYRANENVQEYYNVLATQECVNEEEDVLGPESDCLQNEVAKTFFDLMKDDVPLYPGYYYKFDFFF